MLRTLQLLSSLVPLAILPLCFAGCSRAKEGDTDGALTTVHLCNEYNTDEDAADQKYKGKSITVRGKVLGLSVHPDGSKMVYMLGGTPVEGVFCVFKKDQEEEATKLQSGQPITVQGKCNGKDMGGTKMPQAVVVLE